MHSNIPSIGLFSVATSYILISTFSGENIPGLFRSAQLFRPHNEASFAPPTAHCPSLFGLCIPLRPLRSRRDSIRWAATALSARHEEANTETPTNFPVDIAQLASQPCLREKRHIPVINLSHKTVLETPDR